MLDGRITKFALIPEDRRSAARDALRRRAPFGLPDELGHGIAFYPECPAFWLYEDWLESNEVEEDRGIVYLKQLVGPMLPSRDPLSAQLEMLAISRTMRAGKLHFVEDLEVLELLPKYPTLLELEDRQHVESFSRNVWNALVDLAEDNELSGWCPYFWRRSWEISRCDPDPAEPPPPEDESESPGHLPRERGGSGLDEAGDQPSPDGPRWLLHPDIRLTATSNDPGEDIFIGIGIGRQVDVAAYLDGVDHDVVTDIGYDPFSADYNRRPGETVPTPPASQKFWAASTQGGATQSLEWEVEGGDFQVVE